GPFTSYRKALASWFLKNSRIYTRDEKTYHYLCDTLGLVNVINSKDLAFLDIPYQHNRNINDKVKLKYGLKENSYITIVPSGLVGSYTQNIDAYIQAYVSIVTDILEKHSGIDKVVLLPHVFSSKGPEDLIVIDKIVININKQLLERITVVSDKMHPYEARLILGGGIFTIAGRMHAAVSTYQMKKPAICLSYSVKYDGVIGTGLNMKELVIECANDEIWSSGEIVSQVAKKVKYIEENYDSLIKIIEDKVASVQTEAHEQLVDIAFQLTNIN
ncbi:MAG: polysaccharide pyruvyl transferase family protein, partial [Eubacteriaceae bacterium]